MCKLVCEECDCVCDTVYLVPLELDTIYTFVEEELCELCEYVKEAFDFERVEIKFIFVLFLLN